MLRASNDVWEIIGKFIQCSLRDLRFTYPVVSKLFAECASRFWTKHGNKSVVEQNVDFLNMHWINKHAEAMRGLEAYERIPWVSKFPRCTRLDITIWEEIPTSEQIPASDLFPQLREFVLLNIESISCFQTGFSSLRCLYVSGLFQSVDLKHLNNLPHLASLTLSHCDNIRGFVELEGCASLRWLELFWCKSLASVSGIQQVEHVSITCCGLLKHSALLELEHVVLLHWQLAQTWSTMVHVSAYPIARRFSKKLVDDGPWRQQRRKALTK